MTDRQADLTTRMHSAIAKAARSAQVVNQADKAIRAAAAERSQALAPELDGLRAAAAAGPDDGRYADALVERARLDRLQAAP